MPTVPKAIVAASETSSKSASTMTASGCTGPPSNTRSRSGITSARRPGRASRDTSGVGRLSTRPSAPSSECSSISTTVRRKLGSTRAGAATSRRPRRLSGASSLTGTSPARVPRSRPARRGRFAMLAASRPSKAWIAIGPSRKPVRAKKRQQVPRLHHGLVPPGLGAQRDDHGGPDPRHVPVGGRRALALVRRAGAPARRSTSSRQSVVTQPRNDRRQARSPVGHRSGRHRVCLRRRSSRKL